MVHQLKREGFKLAVCSNSIPQRGTECCARSGVYDLFDCVLSRRGRPPRPNPTPEIYLAACRKLGVQPAETLIVEDAPHGIEAARRSGGFLCEVAGFNEVDYARIKRSLETAG